jgi:uncharacterized membrane protein YphA (DoxX/SURF4 family)
VTAEMDALANLSRLVLAGVFGWAGLAKLFRSGAAADAVADLGIPPGLRRPIAFVLPPAEVGVAVALVLPASAWWGALGAAALLVAFTVLVTARLLRGQTSGCRCFGQRQPSPSAVTSLARNQFLLAFALLLAWHGRGGTGAVEWVAGLGPVRAAALVGAGLLIWAVARAVRRRPGAAARRGSVPSAVRTDDAEGAPTPPTPVSHRHRGPALTIGMATYRDFDGVYFTLQALRMYQDLEDTELLVVDNFGSEDVRTLVKGWAGGRYVLDTEVVGTAAPRDRVFREARGEAVLCLDSHVLLAPDAVARLKRFYLEHPACDDLLQGPMLYDDGASISTHFEPQWRGQMWGTWATDPRGLDEDGDPFDIPMQGLGLFSCRQRAWLGFNPAFRGFGGEEGYIHEKFRRAGRRTLCVPWLRWMHRFGRPDGVPFPLVVEDKLHNYLIGHAELGLDLSPVVQHFGEYLPEQRVREVVEDLLGSRASEELGVTR